MELNDTVEQLLRQKNGPVWSVPPSTSVFDALALMADKNIGALPVIWADTVVGLFSERDYARKVILMGRASRETPVEEIMSTPPIVVTPDQTVGTCMELMTESRIRHLPVTKNGCLIGMVSIGDLVNWIINRQEDTIQHLQQYISGSY
jgi:CBS domain-containing protein